MNLLHRRGWLLLGGAALLAGGAIGVACGPNNNGSDGGVDSGGGDSTTGSDSGKDGQSNNDGGTGNDSGPISCEAGISGSCDIYAQNCGAGKECGVVKLTDGGYELQCITNNSGSIVEGHSCTPSNQNNPCVAGLECIQNRCSKHCCLGDDSVCGKAVPEGYAGRCDLTVTINGTDPAYSICTYSATCQPFQQLPCAANQICGVTDSNGTAKCTTIDTPDGGLPEKATCQYANDCKDGMVCAGNPDGGSGFTCQWACYHPPGPFDAGIATAQPGQGGCPQGETCKTPLGNVPAWYYLCSK